MQYYIPWCTSYFTDLPVQPPVEVDKIWTFAKTKSAFIITCNGVEVLNYLFADSVRNYCVSQWGSDIVEEIEFSSDHDTASDFYKAGKYLLIVIVYPYFMLQCLGFRVVVGAPHR